MKMTRVPLSSVQFERLVKLTPQGKVYKVHSSLGFGRDVVLLDTNGKEVLKGYHTDVYLLPSEFRPTKHALDAACAECGGGYLHKEGCSRELAFFESPRK